MWPVFSLITSLNHKFQCQYFVFYFFGTNTEDCLSNLQRDQTLTLQSIKDIPSES
jgi:hypothetical protein